VYNLETNPTRRISSQSCYQFRLPPLRTGGS